jgi:hypothetical protein
MYSKIIKVFAFSVTGMLFMMCDPIGPQFPAGEVQGYRPIYASSNDLSITFTTARQLQNPGKIYVYGDYLLINEKSKGIHFYDNANPASPKALGFLKMEGNIDMAVKNNVLYADHIGSLVALNIADMDHIVELSRFKTWSNNLPPDEGMYFECVDPSKGDVVGWEMATLKNPECYR